MTASEKSKPKTGDFRRLMFLLTRYARPYWKSIVLLVVVNFIATCLAASLPLMMAPILDIALGKPSTVEGQGTPSLGIGDVSLTNLGRATLQWLGFSDTMDKFHVVIAFGGLYLCIVILHSVAIFSAYLLALWIRVRSARDMQYELFKHILSLPMSFFTRQRTGELVSRLDDDTTATTYGFEGIISNLIMSPLLIAFYGVLLVRTNWMLAMAAIVGGVLHFAVTRGIQKPIRRHVTDRFSVFADLRARLQEALLSIRVVKSFGGEKQELSKLKSAIRDVVRVNMKYGVFKHVEQPVRGVVDGLVIVGIAVFAAHELLAGRLSAPAFVLFLYVGRAVISPISTLGNTWTSIQTTLAASERVFQLFAERPTVRDGSDKVEGFNEAMRFDCVSFAYDEKRVVQDLSIEIRKGQTVALVGPSGAGKSTVADLALRFYDPVSGSITLDGRDLRSLKQEEYRRLFGVVSQEALLFNASVRENITYGRDGLTEDDVIRAAKVANAHEFITELAQGYDTVVGDRGIRLSGGQRQRIAIARAVVANPQILILDEATSALDSESERLVQEAIERVTEQTTALVIAHRLSTVRHADKILVLERGRIVDQGRHEELMGRCELYGNLCRLQFGLAEATC